MRSDLPTTVERLLRSRSSEERDAAWSSFLDEYGDLILHVARALPGDRDDVADRYAYSLEQLRRDGYARLRKYVADGRGKFSTWLVVVLRRMGVDHHRGKYGRRHDIDGVGAAEGTGRRNLVELLGPELDADRLPDENDPGAEALLRREELYQILNGVLTQLDPADRLLLRLRFEDSVSVPEISRRLGFATPFHAYRRLDRLLGDLRRELRRAGVEDPVP